MEIGMILGGIIALIGGVAGFFFAKHFYNRQPNRLEIDPQLYVKTDSVPEYIEPPKKTKRVNAEENAIKAEIERSKKNG